MIKINPIELKGIWDKGYALDIHTLRSIPICEDPFGNVMFDTTYSPIGGLLHDFKYKNKYDKLDEIVEATCQFLKVNPKMAGFEAILPVPPSNRNRLYQPTLEIAKAVAERLNVLYIDTVLEKTTEEQYKNMSSEKKAAMHGMIRQNIHAKRKVSLLLIDDIFDTGSTLRQCTEVLRKDPLINEIYVLTITKRRK